MTNLVVAGVTGLIGSEVLKQDLSPFQQVFCLARKAIDLSSFQSRSKPNVHTKLPPDFQLLNTDFNQIELPQASSTSDAIICALGTTIKKAGSQSAFRQVDYHMVLNLANAGINRGYKRFIVVSSVSADAKSDNFYLKTKGELELALRSLDFEQLCVIRPALLLGPRAEFRIAERIGTILLPLLSPLLIGKLRRYRPVQAKAVAKRLVSESLKQNKPFRIVESEAI
ncbi:hypothetical protein FLL45_06980 [Aliikangiella marina]|uniref:NAD-dependent epimerase/dehydratase family protein n=1 Tax=Aliikangiella marina TaxID=1712262 RepID=A0A545TBV4_9GAMM|nr:NAD-dependent epimerase/dehydratase family protein [Aliikangiella marina]TQV74698.1 hypothetical protein FLL45_06980 [Aliikangiella marina]